MQETARDQSAVLLEGILDTLIQMNVRMVAQEQRWDRLAEGLRSPSTLPSQLVEETRLIPPQPLNLPDSKVSVVKHNEGTRLHHRNSTITQGSQCLPSSSGSRAREEQKLQIDTVDYRSWRSPLETSPLHQYSFLTEELGDAWTIPEDGRIPLSFSREVLEGLRPEQLRSAVSYINKFREKLALHSVLRFHIIDYDGVGGNIVYRLGEPAVLGMQGLKTMPRKDITVDAPWRRFIFCQGLNTAQENEYNYTAQRSAAGCWDQAPFLLHHDRCNTRNYLMTAIDRHIQCWQPDPHQQNPYETYWTAFHITFYEAPSISSPQASEGLPRGSWYYGSLYGSNELDLCESALTLIAIPSTNARPYRPLGHELGRQYDLVIKRDHPCNEWSIILLAPTDFFDLSYHTFPKANDNLQERLGQSSMEEATLCLLVSTYHRLHYNWNLFKRHFRMLLDEGDEGVALFRPSLHDDLLRDDDDFSRLKKYAWAITCLTNFEQSIGNNISQWVDFKSARIEHLLEAGTLSIAGRKSVDDIDRLCTRMRGLHRYFSTKLSSTKAIRDGLFSASNVIESRASTRLAENIKLLTFNLLMLFCATNQEQSLWSVNNTFSSTALIYTSIVVGLSTYIIVFHINSLVYTTSTAYAPIRGKIISRMREHGEGLWGSKGRQFATFQLRHERLRPSEWWILLFWIHNLVSSLCQFLLRKNMAVQMNAGSSPEVIVIGNENQASIIGAGAGISAPPKQKVSTTPRLQEASRDTNQVLIAESLPSKASRRNNFPIQIRLSKGGRADANTHEEV